MGCGMICVKYLVFILNLLFALTGLIILVTGGIIVSTYAHYSTFVGDALWSAPILMIIVGSVIFVIAFFGCCGAAKENSCMILTFSVLLVLVFLFEVGIGIAGYIKHNDLQSILENSFNKTLQNYNKSNRYQMSWDFLQNELNCCGIKSADDWEPVFNNETLPESCCHQQPMDANICTKPNASHDGCMQKLYAVLNNKALLLGGIGIGIALAQVIGVAFACCLSNAFRKNYETV